MQFVFDLVAAGCSGFFGLTLRRRATTLRLLLIAFSTEYLGRAFNRLTQLEKWVRLVAGVLFVLVGVYYSLTHIYGLSLRVY